MALQVIIFRIYDADKDESEFYVAIDTAEFAFKSVSVGTLDKIVLNSPRVFDKSFAVKLLNRRNYASNVLRIDTKG